MGTFAAGTGNSACANCTVPAPGFYCPVASETDNAGVPCWAGSACAGGGATAVPCAAGYFSPAAAQGACSPCPLATYSTGNATNCSACVARPTKFCGVACPSVNGTDCPPGYACPTGGTAQPTACPAGSYSTGGVASCSLCAQGYYGSAPGSTASNCTAPCTPTPTKYCPPGSVSDTLLPCPAGSRCPGAPLAAAYPCAPGSFSRANATQCQDCPAGRFGGLPGLGSHECEGPCTLPAGFFCAPGSTGPLDSTPCPVGGFVCQGGSALPSFCAAGLYLTPAGCVDCPAGSTCAGGAAQPV
jgi:hypothetical protein